MEHRQPCIQQRLRNWTYEVTGLQTSDEGVQDNVTLDYEIYMLGSGEPQLVRNMKDSGSYYIQVVGVSDSNYTISGIERHDVTVDQATPVIADVVYKEYSTDNVTYAGNEKLRNEKLSYTAKCNDVDVAGKLEFADSSAASIATVGTNYHYCVFTPENANYKSVEYRDLRIEVKPDSVERLGYDSKTVLSPYAVGQPFTPFLVAVYFEYASYYTETVDGKVESFGKHELIEDNTKVTFTYNNNKIDMEKGYKFTEEDVGEVTISLFALNNGQTKRGEIKATVLDSIPVRISILNVDELQAEKYYVGSTFDKSKVRFFVEYETETSNGEISADNVQIDETTAVLDKVGTCKVTFIYASLKVSLDVTVIPKEIIKIANPSGTYRYLDGEPITPTIKQTNGEPLPSDVTFAMTDSSGNVLNMRELGTYNIIIKFTVDTAKYEPIADIEATIVVQDIVVDLDPTSYREPKNKLDYTGKALADVDYKLQGNVVVVDNEDPNRKYTIVETTYIINGVASDKTEICEAGNYEIIARFTVKSVPNDASEEALVFTFDHTYSIEIAPVSNVISTFTVNSWIFESGTGTVTFKSSFGEPVYEYYLLADSEDEEGRYVGSTLPTEIGKYRVVATVMGTKSYSAVDGETTFEIRKPMLNVEADVNGEPLKDENGNDIVEVTGKDGVDPYYGLRVELLKEEKTSKANIKNQVVVTGYDIDIVDSNNNVVTDHGEYTVRLLLTAEQRDSKNFRNFKVSVVDDYGVVLEEVKDVKLDGEYLVFTTSNFNGDFIVSAQDAAAITQMAWIIGVSVGGVIALAAVIILIVVVIKKKKEND